MKNGSEIISYGQTTYGRFRADYANIFETGKCRLIIQRPRESDSGGEILDNQSTLNCYNDKN